MTYNFDPDTWLESRLRLLEHRLDAGEIDARAYEEQVDLLHRQYEAMVDRLDGTYTLPETPQ